MAVRLPLCSQACALDAAAVPCLARPRVAPMLMLRSTCCARSEVLTGAIGWYIVWYICMAGWPAVERAARDDQARELQGSQAALGC